MWNGLTTLELVHVISDIICGDYYNKNTFHIFSNDISKHDMIQQVAEVYNLDINLTATKTKIECDRRLRTVKKMNDLTNQKPFKKMVQELKEFEDIENE